jgi:hypothetical protein
VKTISPTHVSARVGEPVFSADEESIVTNALEEYEERLEEFFAPKSDEEEDESEG